jgi:hypothetical protein
LKSALLTTSPEGFLKELDGLTLTKYAEEIQAAVLEGVSGTAAKGKADVEGAVEVGPFVLSQSIPCMIIDDPDNSSIRSLLTSMRG